MVVLADQLGLDLVILVNFVDDLLADEAPLNVGSKVDAPSSQLLFFSPFQKTGSHCIELLFTDLVCAINARIVLVLLCARDSRQDPRMAIWIARI